ncbi:MAG: hypothetical protein PVSMB4_20210 [Ktedonobacterales bacterium]
MALNHETDGGCHGYHERCMARPAPRRGNWIDQELDESVFQDARLGRRLRVLLGQLAQAPGQSMALVCQDWANTKAAYRFLSNERISEADILTGHFAATRERLAATREAPVLMLHDTTEFSWQRDSAQAIGVLATTNSAQDAEGRMRHHTVYGLLMHSSLAVTTEGLPLGLAAIKFPDTPEVLGHQRAQAIDQSDACAYRTEGKHVLARQCAPSQCDVRAARPMCACRRPQQRHLRAVLRDP